MNTSCEPLPENGDKAEQSKHVLQRTDDLLSKGSHGSAREDLARERPDYMGSIFGPAYEAWVRPRIERHIKEAERFADAQDFTSALHVITLAYIMNPNDEGLRVCEQRILAMQQRIKAHGQISRTLVTGDNTTTAASAEGDEDLMMRVSEHIAEADRLRAAHQFDEALDEIAKALTLDPSNESIQRYEKTIHELHICAQEELQQRVRRAKELRVNGRYEEALVEISLGLVGEPNSAELLRLRKDMLGEHPGPLAEGPENRAEGTEDLVRSHLGAAEEFRKINRFSEALDEISKAYAIDPTNEETRKAEERIRDSEARLNQPRSLFLNNPFRNRRTPGGRL